MLLFDNSSYLHWCVCCLHWTRSLTQNAQRGLAEKLPWCHLNATSGAAVVDFSALCFLQTGKPKCVQFTSLAQLIFGSSSNRVRLVWFGRQTYTMTNRIEFIVYKCQYIQICIQIMKAGNVSCEQNRALKLCRIQIEENYYAKCNGFQLFTTTHQNTNHYCSLTLLPNLWVRFPRSWSFRVTCLFPSMALSRTHTHTIHTCRRWITPEMSASINTCQLCVAWKLSCTNNLCVSSLCIVCQVCNKIIRTILFRNNCSLPFE